MIENPTFPHSGPKTASPRVTHPWPLVGTLHSAFVWRYHPVSVSPDCPPKGIATGSVAFKAFLALVVLQRLNQALVVFFHLQEDGLGDRFVVALLGLGGDD